MNTDYGTTSDHIGAGLGVFIGVMVLIYVAVVVVTILAYVKIANKAGYSGWYVLLLFVPIANIVVLLMFAFKDWPITQEVAWLRQRVQQLEAGGGGQYGQQAFPPPAARQQLPPWEGGQQPPATT